MGDIYVYIYTLYIFLKWERKRRGSWKALAISWFEHSIWCSGHLGVMYKHHPSSPPESCSAPESLTLMRHRGTEPRAGRPLRPPSGSLSIAHVQWITILITPLFLLPPPMSTTDFVEDTYIYEGTSPHLLFLISHVFQFLAITKKCCNAHLCEASLC